MSETSVGLVDGWWTREFIPVLENLVEVEVETNWSRNIWSTSNDKRISRTVRPGIMKFSGKALKRESASVKLTITARMKRLYACYLLRGRVRQASNPIWISV